jgi:hypothetical protein
MNLSILILTHQRPKLFERCINSVLPYLDDILEVIVNNDSGDIEEITHPSITYHYNRFEFLSEIYEFLYRESKGEYIYFLEDDDYLASGFSTIKLEGDLIIGNYYPTYKPDYAFACMSSIRNGPINIKDINLERLQLSQFIFKRDSMCDFIFPEDSNIHNDIRLVQHVAAGRIIKGINKIIYYQTTDGGDNISFTQSSLI